MAEAAETDGGSQVLVDWKFRLTIGVMFLLACVGVASCTGPTCL